MELLYLKYQTASKQTKLILLLSLGQRNSKLCGLIASAVSDSERSIILNSRSKLTGLPIEQKLKWLKNHCPHAYTHSYRELPVNKSVIISTHQFK